MRNIPGLFLPLVVLSACGGSKKGVSFSAPKIGPIVEAAVPSGLKSGAYYLDGGECTSENPSVCATSAGFLQFIKGYVFKKDTSGKTAAPTFYRYWVDVVDATLDSLNSRLKETEEDAKGAACLKKEATQVSFKFPLAGKEIETVSKFYCWEEQNHPEGGVQNFAFGKDATHTYLAFRTDDKAKTGGKGSRIVSAKVSNDGNIVEVWFIGSSWQNAAIGSSELATRVGFQRVVANKADGTFTFNSVEDPDLGGYLFASYFANSDGKKIYMEARTSNGPTEKVDVTGMVPGTGGCISATNLNEAASDCTALAKPASAFALTHSLHNREYTAADGTVIPTAFNRDTFAAAVSTIQGLDYSALGVSKLSP